MSRFKFHINSNSVTDKLSFSAINSCLGINILRKYSTILLIIGFISFVAPKTTFAQRDTPGTASKTDSIIEYLTPLEYAFMMHEETKFMLRLPVLGIGAEVEVLPYFTLMAEARFLTGYNQGYTIYEIGYFENDFSLTGEARYYYGSKKKGIRNMSGNYFGLGYKYQADLNSESPNIKSNRYYAKWGMQRRFLGSGLIDLGISVGLEKNNRNFARFKSDHVFFQTTGTVGLGLVFNNEKTLDKDRLCLALQCFERETFIVKLNTLNLLNYIYYYDNVSLGLLQVSPQAGVEQKLFNSPFSVATNLKLYLGWFHNESNQSSIKPDLELDIRLKTRYYYNLKSRILKGKSGNGFSANYVSGGYYEGYSTGYNEPLSVSDYGITLTTGIQRTFSNHFYFDAELGGAYDLRNDEGLFLYGDVQVGIKF